MYVRHTSLCSCILSSDSVPCKSSTTVTFIEALNITILPRPANFPLPGCYTLAKVPLKNSLPAWYVYTTEGHTIMVINRVSSGSSTAALPVRTLQHQRTPRTDGTNIVLFRSASNIPQLDVIQILHERGVQARAVQRETEFPDQVVRDTAFQPASLPPAS